MYNAHASPHETMQGSIIRYTDNAHAALH